MLDIRKLARKFAIPMVEAGHHHVSDGWVGLPCPSCGSREYHLGFSLTSGAFACWRCGKLKFWDVLPPLLGMSEGQVREILPDYLTGLRPKRKIVARYADAKMPPGAGPMGPLHRRYLRGRGFDPERLEKEWGLKGTGHVGGLWAWRVVVPIRNASGRTVAFQGRAIGNAVSKRYMMSRDEICSEDPRTFVYGIDKAKGDAVIIVEGAPGVWRMGPGTVGTLGISWKRQQANRLRRYARRYILFDPEPEAQRRARELAECLGQFEGETEILSGFDTDPGEFPDELVGKIRKELGV